MKTCPNCKMTVDAYSECPICNYDITSEPKCDAQFERYHLNKYVFIHLIKKHAFPLLCTIITLTIIFANGFFHYLEIISLIIIALMWFEALFKNLSFKLSEHIFTDLYLESVNKISVFGGGILAIACASVTLLLK